MRNSKFLTYLAIGAGLIFADRIAAFFAPDRPGGDVDPRPDDERPATLTASAARSLADTLYVAFYGGGIIETPWENDAAATVALMVPQVSADVRLLLNAYGTRGTHLTRKNLAETVADLLDDDYRRAVNADYRSKGILHTW